MQLNDGAVVQKRDCTSKRLSCALFGTWPALASRECQRIPWLMKRWLSAHTVSLAEVEVDVDEAVSRPIDGASRGGLPHRTPIILGAPDLPYLYLSRTKGPQSS